MRILYFVQYFNLPDEPGGSRAYQFARAWTRSGHFVTIVTGAVNHKTLEVAPRYRGRIVTEERIDGIRVLRSWSYAGIRGSYRKRLLNFLSFALVASVVGTLRGGRADVVYASSTPLTVGIPGWIAAFFRRAPLFFEVRDLWPQSAVAAGVLRSAAPLTRAASGLARFLYTRAARVVAVTRGIAAGVVAEGIPAEKVLFIPNGVDDWMVDSGNSRGALPDPAGAGHAAQSGRTMGSGHVPGSGDSGEPGVFRLVYCGAHGVWNGLGQILDAAVLLREEPIEFVFIGDGDERENLMARARREGLANMRFVGAIPKREAFERLRSASACIVVTWKHPFQKMVLANKIFDYLAAARPVVVAAEGEMAELVREAACGVIAPPEEPDRLAEAIRQLVRMDAAEREALGRRGREHILRHYRRADLADALAERFAEVTHAAGRGSPSSASERAEPKRREAGSA